MNNNYPLIYKLSNNADYSEITNKPKINNVELYGNKSSSDLGLADTTTVGDLTTLTTTEQSSIVGAINEIDGKFPIAIADGGTGGTTATSARTNLGVMTGVQLYYNAAGNTGTITLNDNISNYKCIEITAKNYAEHLLGWQICHNESESFSACITINTPTLSTLELSIQSRVINMSGTTLSWGDGLYALLNNTNVSTAGEGSIGIIKITGYKF